MCENLGPKKPKLTQQNVVPGGIGVLSYLCREETL